jgi:hypothetical protein
VPQPSFGGTVEILDKVYPIRAIRYFFPLSRPSPTGQTSCCTVGFLSKVGGWVRGLGARRGWLSSVAQPYCCLLGKAENGQWGGSCETLYNDVVLQRDAINSQVIVQTVRRDHQLKETRIYAGVYNNAIVHSVQCSRTNEPFHYTSTVLDRS